MGGSFRRWGLKIFSLCAELTVPFRVFLSRMPHELFLQGRPLSAPDLAQIQRWLAEHPAWHRTRLSRELCMLWHWRNEAGQLEDMACRSLLLKLQARGWIALPPRQRPAVNGQRNRPGVAGSYDTAPLQTELAALRPLRVEPLGPASPDLGLFQGLLQQHHYLGQRNCVGENLKYLVRDRQDRPLACLLFGSAAWQCQPRDAFLGWSPAQRQRHLSRLTNNTRFLILPWVRVPHLARSGGQCDSEPTVALEDFPDLPQSARMAAVSLGLFSPKARVAIKAPISGKCGAPVFQWFHQRDASVLQLGRLLPGSGYFLQNQLSMIFFLAHRKAFDPMFCARRDRPWAR